MNAQCMQKKRKHMVGETVSQGGPRAHAGGCPVALKWKVGAVSLTDTVSH